MISKLDALEFKFAEAQIELRRTVDEAAQENQVPEVDGGEMILDSPPRRRAASVGNVEAGKSPGRRLNRKIS